MKTVQPVKDIKQIERIKKVLKGQSLRDHALFVLGINSGLRISVLLSLKIRDVVDDRTKVRDRVTIREGKTGKIKDFPLGKTAGKALKEYIDSRKDISLEDPLFLSRKGGGFLGRSQAYRIINSAARTVGIKDSIGTHTLRKTFGYHAYIMGMDLSVIQKLLNHSSPAITLSYIGITREDLDKVYMSLNL